MKSGWGKLFPTQVVALFLQNINIPSSVAIPACGIMTTPLLSKQMPH